MKKLNYKSPEVGQEISCMMYNPDKEFLKDNKKLESVLKEALIKNKFNILESSSHEYPPQGYTATFTLSESHLAVHTYPEHKSIYVSMYSCRGPEDALPVIRGIQKKLKPTNIALINQAKVPASINAAKKLHII